MTKQLYYDDIALIAKYFSGDSRSKLDTSVKLGKYTFKAPIIPANMKCSINFELAEWLGSNGYFYILHRFYPYDEILEWVEKVGCSDINVISLSVGVQDKDKQFIDKLASSDYDIDYITIDIAHGHSLKMKEMISYIKDKMPETFVIAGNVMTQQAVNDLTDWGASCAKIGLGQGKSCSTKLETGFTMPMFSCTLECCKIDTLRLRPTIEAEVQEELQKYISNGYSLAFDSDCHPTIRGPEWIRNLHKTIDRLIFSTDEVEDRIRDSRDAEIERRLSNHTQVIPVITDGGIRHNGDIAKAITAGATMVMAGSIFAACKDSPSGNVTDGEGGVLYKRYFGSASEYNKGHNKNVEGFMVELPCNGLTYEQKLDQIQQSLQSSISYSGGEKLSDLRNTEWRILT